MNTIDYSNRTTLHKINSSLHLLKAGLFQLIPTFDRSGRSNSSSINNNPRINCSLKRKMNNLYQTFTTTNSKVNIKQESREEERDEDGNEIYGDAHVRKQFIVSKKSEILKILNTDLNKEREWKYNYNGNYCDELQKMKKILYNNYNSERKVFKGIEQNKNNSTIVRRKNIFTSSDLNTITNIHNTHKYKKYKNTRPQNLEFDKYLLNSGKK